MLSSEQIRSIDDAVQQVARNGHGAVVIVVERGKARRLRLEVDLPWETVAVHGSEQVLELNSKKIKTA